MSVSKIELVELIEGEVAKLSPRGRELWERLELHVEATAPEEATPETLPPPGREDIEIADHMAELPWPEQGILQRLMELRAGLASAGGSTPATRSCLPRSLYLAVPGYGIVPLVVEDLVLLTGAATHLVGRVSWPSRIRTCLHVYGVVALVAVDYVAAHGGAECFVDDSVVALVGVDDIGPVAAFYHVVAFQAGYLVVPGRVG